MTCRNPICALFLMSILLVPFNVAFGESLDRAGKVGISGALLQDQISILVPIWTSQHVVFSPAVSFSYFNESSDDDSYDFGIGAVVKYAFGQSNAAPYVGMRGGIITLSPSDGDSLVDKFIGAMGGGEYFFNNHLSFAVEAQLNVSFSDENSSRFGNPDGTNVNTATVLFATFYF